MNKEYKLVSILVLFLLSILCILFLISCTKSNNTKLTNSNNGIDLVYVKQENKEEKLILKADKSVVIESAGKQKETALKWYEIDYILFLKATETTQYVYYILDDGKYLCITEDNKYTIIYEKEES